MNMNRKNNAATPVPARQRGGLLIEGMVSALIFSIAILGFVGLQGSMVRLGGDAKYRSDAAFLTNQIVGQMWGDAGQLNAYATPGGNKAKPWLATVEETLPEGNGTIDVSGNQVTVTVSWQAGSADTGKRTHNYVAVAEIKL